MNINNFKGIAAVARYYYPTLRLQLILYPGISLVIAALTFALGFVELGLLFSSMFSVVVAWMLYFGPISFTRHSDRVIETMLPARATDKWAFISIYCLFVLPVITIGLSGLVTLILGAIYGQPPFAVEVVQRFNIHMAWYTPIFNYLQAIVPTATCMYCVISLRRNRVTLSIVWTIAILVVFALAGMAWGVWLAFHEGFTDAINSRAADIDSDALAQQMIDMLGGLTWTLGLFSVAYVAVMLWLSRRKISNFQI